MKYHTIENSINGQINSFTTNESIEVFPANYTATITDLEFVRSNIIYSNGNLNGYRSNSVSGILRFDIFVEVGAGTGRLSTISDLLDNYFQLKNLSNVQFSASNMVPQGIDTVDSSYFRGNYSIQFNYNQ